MILTNKRTTYTVNHSNETIKLNGHISIDEAGVIESFSGSFTNVIEEAIEGEDVELGINLGGFSYNENDGHLNKSIYNIPFEEEANVLALLDEAIEEIKTEVEPDILSE